MSILPKAYEYFRAENFSSNHRPNIPLTLNPLER